LLDTPQVSLLTEVLVEGSLSAVVQFNYDDSYDQGRTNGRLGIVESYLRYEYRLSEHQKITARMGRVIPPVSLEHPETAWSTRYTITPSAINTWIGEEIRPAALEMKYRYDYASFSHIEFIVAPFSGNDSSGSLLAWRGWALHDYQSTLGSRVRFSKYTPESIAPQGRWGEPFKEIDGYLGVYTKIGWTLNPQWRTEGFYSNSFADHDFNDIKNEYPWSTVLGNLSLQYTPVSEWVFAFQGMSGNTRMGKSSRSGVNNDFNSWYFLLSYLYDAHRITVRYDDFRVIDLDKHPEDINESQGNAVTIAYLLHQSEFHIIGLEYLGITSKRKIHKHYPEDIDDDLYQLMYRLNF